MSESRDTVSKHCQETKNRSVCYENDTGRERAQPKVTRKNKLSSSLPSTRHTARLLYGAAAQQLPPPRLQTGRAAGTLEGLVVALKRGPRRGGGGSCAKEDRHSRLSTTDVSESNGEWAHHSETRRFQGDESRMRDPTPDTTRYDTPHTRGKAVHTSRVSATYADMHARTVICV